MKKYMKFLLDYDDVLVECNSMAVEWLNKEKGTHYTIYDINKWGRMNNELDERLKYFSMPEFVRSQKPMLGAREFVQELCNIGEVFIMTTVPTVCVGDRITHSLNTFPEIPIENIIIGNRKNIVNADMSLDDGCHNLESSSVKYPVMYQRPWNYGKTGFLSVNGYTEFLNLARNIAYRQENRKPEVVSIVGPKCSGKWKLGSDLVGTGLFGKVKTYSTRWDIRYHTLDADEFKRRESAGFFMETSNYHGDHFGICKSDIESVISRGKIPLCVLDINGAMSIQAQFNAMNVFAFTSKEKCVMEILRRDEGIDETAKAILSLDAEIINERFCDLSVDPYCGGVQKVVDEIAKRLGLTINELTKRMEV